MPKAKSTTAARAAPAKRKAASRSAAKRGSAARKLSVKQVRSGIGHPETFRRTLKALGLRHHQQTVLVEDNPSIQGMLYKVRHLVEVTPVQGA